MTSLLTAGLVVVLPSVLPRLLGLFRPRGHRRLPAPALTHAELFLLALHAAVTLAHLVSLLRQTDPLAGLPLLAVPLSALRQRLTPAHPALLQKLHAFDARTTYARLGPTPLLACEACSLPSSSPMPLLADYTLFHLLSLASTVLLGPALVWALMTARGERRRWRPLGLWSIALLTLAEGGYATLGPITTGQGDVWRLFLLLPPIRTLFHLLLPFALLLLPSSPPSPPPPLFTLPPLLTSSASLLQTLKLLEVSHLALARNPALSHRLLSTGAALRLASEAAHASPAVEDAAERVGLTAGEDVRGGLREGARRFLAGARAGIVDRRQAHSHSHGE